MSFFTRSHESVTASIANGAQSSGAINIKAFTSGSFQLPAAFTGTSLTFEVSVDGTTFVALKNSAGTSISAVTVSAGSQLPIPTEAFSFPWLKIKSGSTELAARSIGVFLKA